MLHLKRVLNPFEWERDKITGEYIQYGDYYYWDDEDDFVISFENYRKLKRQEREANWDYTRLNQAESQREYEQMIKDKTREFLAEDVLKRKVAKGAYE